MRPFILLSLTGMIAAAPALAQSGAAGQPSPGTTSGPAAGSPVTLGTGGVTTAAKHMRSTVRGHEGAAVRNEGSGQTGGTTAQPGKSDAGAGTHQAPQPK
jgi:hypothetical protein